jgi:hypothetical protein
VGDQHQQRDPREEAREFLVAFLGQLQAGDQTNRALLRVQVQLLTQLQADYQQRSLVSAQLDGVAQRLDLVDHGLASLAATLEGGDLPELADYTAAPVRPQPRYPSPGQAIGGLVGFGVDRVMRGGGGGRRGR